MIIGVSHTMGSEEKFQRYLDWLGGSGRDIRCRTLSYVADDVEALGTCDALVLTGGHDVHPSLYDGPIDHPALTATDIRRDAFEARLLDGGMRKAIPILGICRGLQFANVHFGGSLIPDLESEGLPSHRSPSGECSHAVNLKKGTLIASIAGSDAGIVNSSHHQAVRKAGRGLVATAWSPDGVVEAMELDTANSRPFFLLVQWHPERMEDADNSLGFAIAEKFIRSIHDNANA